MREVTISGLLRNILMKRALVCSSDDSKAASTGLTALGFAELIPEMFVEFAEEFAPKGALLSATLDELPLPGFAGAILLTVGVSTVACAKVRLGASRATLTAKAMDFFTRPSFEPFVVIFYMFKKSVYKLRVRGRLLSSASIQALTDTG